MSFFNWLSKKPIPVRDGLNPTSAGSHATRSAVPVPVTLTPQPQIPAAETATASAAVPPSVERKVRRHARREQLYVAIRESMTRAGMLSASYKFKVLSLDQNGDQFLVMMDVAAELTTSAAKLSHTEEILVQTARAGYDIAVTAVYWRVDPKSLVKSSAPAASTVATHTALAPETAVMPSPASATVARLETQADPFAETQANTVWVPEPSRHDPLLEAEVAAFKRALASVPPEARPAGPKAPVITAPPDNVTSKARSIRLSSYALITGFEDTAVPDTSAVPALSPTQYGELN